MEQWMWILAGLVVALRIAGLLKWEAWLLAPALAACAVWLGAS